MSSLVVSQSVSQQVNAFTLVVCRTCIPNPLSRFAKPEQAKVMYSSNLLYVFVKVVKSICIYMGPSCPWQWVMGHAYGNVLFKGLIGGPHTATLTTSGKGKYPKDGSMACVEH